MEYQSKNSRYTRIQINLNLKYLMPTIQITQGNSACLWFTISFLLCFFDVQVNQPTIINVNVIVNEWWCVSSKSKQSHTQSVGRAACRWIWCIVVGNIIRNKQRRLILVMVVSIVTIRSHPSHTRYINQFTMPENESKKKKNTLSTLLLNTNTNTSISINTDIDRVHSMYTIPHMTAAGGAVVQRRQGSD